MYPEQAQFSRNLGFMTTSEQNRLINSSVAIAGAGGDGGMLAIQLARLGVGELRLADPDPFELENMNRQACCTTETVGVNKAVAVGDYINKINPDINVVTYTEGVKENNVADFIKGSDLVIDETEFTLHSIGVMIARQARKEGISNLMAMNIGFGTTVTSFKPDGKTFESTLGLSDNATIEEIESSNPSISHWLSYLPPYGDLSVLKKVASGEKSAPSIAPGVAVAAGVGASQAFLHLVANGGNNRQAPVTAPHILMIDAMTGESRTIKHPVASHYKYLAKLLIKSAVGKNSSASY